MKVDVNQRAHCPDLRRRGRGQAGTVGAAAALSGGDDDAQERPIPTRSSSSTSGLLSTRPAASVSETEVDDEESNYEVEVTLDDGTEVDVPLDENSQVVGTEDEGTKDDIVGAGD